MFNKRKILIVGSKRLLGKVDGVCQSSMISLRGFQMELENRYRLKLAEFLEKKGNIEVKEKFIRLKSFLKIDTKKIHFTKELYCWYIREYNELKEFLETCCKCC